MQEAYQKEFNLKFEIFHNFADPQKLPFKSKPSSTFTLEKPQNCFSSEASLSTYIKVPSKMLPPLMSYTLWETTSFDIYGQVQPSDYIEE